MILCEYRFDRFNARGNDEYLDRFADHLNELLGSGWTAPEVIRDSASSGWWLVCLFKDRSSQPQESQA